ncbi:cuticle collagen 40-like [Rhineura floridana]|uniref:cuticle collagen 40-like n=1 Tax=Rhineura floridana TaxID=261503 RepID=UPI002AC8700B|nr:cuticle collagen 40-like [Rhineura floridana]
MCRVSPCLDGIGGALKSPLPPQERGAGAGLDPGEKGGSGGAGGGGRSEVAPPDELWRSCPPRTQRAFRGYFGVCVSDHNFDSGVSRIWGSRRAVSCAVAASAPFPLTLVRPHLRPSRAPAGRGGGAGRCLPKEAGGERGPPREAAAPGSRLGGPPGTPESDAPAAEARGRRQCARAVRTPRARYCCCRRRPRATAFLPPDPAGWGPSSRVASQGGDAGNERARPGRRSTPPQPPRTPLKPPLHGHAPHHPPAARPTPRVDGPTSAAKHASPSVTNWTPRGIRPTEPPTG